MPELIAAATQWIGPFLDGIASNLWLSLLFIFLIAAGEAVFILGLFVPSTPVLLFAGGLIAQGRLPFWEVYAVTVIGAVIGDAISFSVGFWLKDRVKLVWPFRHHRALIEQGERFFQRHGGKSVFIGRFIPGVKSVVPGIAGMFGMPYRHFTIINVVSAFVWAAAHLIPGMLLSRWLEAMGFGLETVIVVFAVVLAAVFVIGHFGAQWVAQRNAARALVRQPPIAKS